MRRCLNYIDSPLPRCQLSRTGSLCSAGHLISNTRHRTFFIHFALVFNDIHLKPFYPLYQAKNATGIPCCEERACASRPLTCRPAPPPPPPPPWTLLPPPHLPPWPLHPTAPTLDFNPAAASGVVLSSTSGLSLHAFVHCLASFCFFLAL